MAGSAIEFTLALIDRISAPAKAASVALSALESQLKSVQSLLKEMPKLAVKIPKLATEGARAAREKVAPVERAAQFGPTRKEAEKAARYREQQAAKAAREATRLAALQSREQARVAREAERYSVDYHVRQLQRSKAQDEARKAAMKHLGISDAAPARRLVNGLGAERAVTFVDNLKELGTAFEEVTGLSAKAGLAIGGFGVAIGLAAVGVVKFGAALAGWILDGAKLAIDANDAKGDALDMYEAMLGSADAAERTLAAVRDITRTTTASQGAVEASAQALTAAGVTNEKLLQDSVKSIAQVDSVLKGYGGKIEGIIEKAAQTGKFELNPKKLLGTGVQVQKLYEEIAKRTGKGVKAVEAQLKAGKIKAEVGIAALTKVIDDKFGAIAAKQAKDFPVQMQRFKDSVARLFEDVDTQPFLDALDRVISLFDGSSQAGGAAKDIITAAFNGIFQAVTRVEPYVTTFFKGLMIVALQVAIALKPLMKQLGMTFGGEQIEGPKRLAEVMSLVGLGLRTLITWAIKLQPIFSAVWSVASTVGGAMFSLASTLMFGLPLAIGRLIGAIVMAVGWFTQFGDRAVEAGSNVVIGLIDGIKNAAGQLYAAIVDIATNALDKFKNVFGIHSPSRVMAGMGANLSVGLAQGIEAGAGASTGAMVGAGSALASNAAIGASAGVLSLPQITAPAFSQRPLTGNDNAYQSRSEQPRVAPREAQGRGSNGPAVLHMEAGAVVIQLGSGGAEELEQKFPEMMSNWWERVALSNGTG